MTTQTRRAAQYIRMSTDRQDLSPLEQKDAIAAFAASHDFEIVRNYEDDGKSGVGVSNRPGLLRLIADVANKPDFSAVLVYDVSRWGRFQDIDAAAYYEYHCRLHAVQVIFVNEPFSNDLAPASAL
jgi:DNA invertase Pin-like site-specific DNA recombinase